MENMTTAELRSVMMDTLDEIHAFCEKNGLTYYLWGGTLLGAIRHDGFIPWDDDIDIAMPRRDYEFLVNNFDNENYGVFSCESDPAFPYTFAKAFDKRTEKIEPIHKKKPFSIGVDVDIFPIDDYSDPEAINKTVKWRNRKIFEQQFKIFKFRKIRSLRSLAANFIIAFFRVFGKSANKLAVEINRKGTSFNNGKGEHMLYADSNIKKPLILKRDWDTETVPHKFEDREYMIPVNYDGVLTAIFGSNYMTPPPKEKQITHHTFDAYFKETNK